MNGWPEPATMTMQAKFKLQTCVSVGALEANNDERDSVLDLRRAVAAPGFGPWNLGVAVVVLDRRGRQETSEW
ncbi:hypothetical protein EJB05_39383 [Eragrostis curvula]|uniref:Uncharacterized protein n=1 Tax=Eragrostis curvula TaxID=38414 RepID=A0A5J9TWS5_9POAL|nr:hypothetical protein EJB05_39383 [Eragrostis curvula]